MRIAKPTLAPSRQGKRQLVIFLEPPFAAQIRGRATYEGKTVQEILGEAMNMALKAMKRRQAFPVGHQRFIVRKVSNAMPRDPERTSSTRGGRASVSGWFKTECLDYVNSVAVELGTSLQSIAERGLQDLMATPKTKAPTKPPSAARRPRKPKAPSTERK